VAQALASTPKCVVPSTGDQSDSHCGCVGKYRNGEMPAPMITVRVRRDGAQDASRARRRSVPVVENPPLARELFALR